MLPSCPVVSIERELASGTLHRAVMADLSVRRQLRLITHPARYCSRASAAFRREILPVFASPDSPPAPQSAHSRISSSP